MKRSVYIVEDHVLVQEALVMMIDLEPDMRVCGTAASAADALVALDHLSPDLVLSDVSLPEMSGFDFLERLRDMKPSQWIALISGHREASYAELAVEHGARGYIVKENPVAMVDGIRQILDGHVYVSASIVNWRPAAEQDH